MTNSEKRRQYFRKYYQSHKEQCLERYRRNYQKRKELGIVTGDVDLYHTLDELKQGEEQEFGAVGEAINWSKWAEVIEQTKQDIIKALEDYKAPPRRKAIYVFVINSKEPIMKFETSDQAAEKLGIQRMMITNLARSHKPIKDKGIYLSYDKTTN